MRCVVSVWTRWGDYVLSVRDVRRGESLSVGSPPQRLLSFRYGAPRVWPGAPREGQQARALNPGETLTVRRGELEYTLCSFAAEAGPSFEPARRTWAFGDAIVVGVLCAVLGWHPPKTALVAVSTPALAQAAQRADEESPEPAPTERALVSIVAQPEPEQVTLPGETRCGRFEAGHGAADPEARGRYGVVGPIDNVDPHLARPVPGEGYPTATGTPGLVRPETPAGSTAPTAEFGRDAALGTDASNARAELWGDELRETWGEDGSGAVGRAGGVLKTFHVQPLASAPEAPLRMVHTGLRVIGPRKASEIGRAMAAHFDDFRGCAAGMEPTTELRVRLEFDVAQDGHASATQPSGGALAPCLARSLSRVTFVPGTTAVTHVVYPLYFVAAGKALQAL